MARCCGGTCLKRRALGADGPCRRTSRHHDLREYGATTAFARTSTQVSWNGTATRLELAAHPADKRLKINQLPLLHRTTHEGLPG